MLCNKSLYILLTNWLHILFKANLGNKFTTAADILSQIRDVFFYSVVFYHAITNANVWTFELLLCKLAQSDWICTGGEIPSHYWGTLNRDISLVGGPKSYSEI